MVVPAASLINIYCDESSHLEKDGRAFMGLGALSASQNIVRDVAREIRGIKRAYAMPERQELKWVKVSNSNVSIYEAVLRRFFQDEALRFRIVLADKLNLDHAAYGQTHDEWYYKMYFTLLTRILDQRNRYEIYLDLKDTLGGAKIKNMRAILSNAMWDFDNTSIRKIQLVRSHEVTLLQVADILIGAVCYANQPNQNSRAKIRLVNLVRELSGYQLDRSTSLAAEKFNIFCWFGSAA